MDQHSQPPNASHRVSGLPRPISRLPVPRAAIRSSPSVESLQPRSAINHSVSNPRLRNSPSRDQVSLSTSPGTRTLSTSKNRELSPSSTGTVIHNPPPKQPFLRRSSSNARFKRPLQPATAEQSQVRPSSRDTDSVIQEDDQGAIEPAHFEDTNKRVPRKPRLSLSERTMETLQSIPSSPAVQRKSSFFTTESPMRASSRASASSRPDSSHTDASMRPPYRSISSRPSSSSGSGQSIPLDFRASTNTFHPPVTALQNNPIKRPDTAKSHTPSRARSIKVPISNNSSRIPSPTAEPSMRQGSPSPVRAPAKASALKYGSKTLNSRPLKPRASINGLFRKPSMPALDQPSEIDKIDSGINRLPSSFSASSEDATISSLSIPSSRTNTTPASDDQTTIPKSSLTLREQIAKAKAAKRAAMKTAPSAVSSSPGQVPVIPAGTFDFGLSQDPFNQQIDPDGSKGLLRKRIDSARTDGRLNIAAMGLKEIPEEVFNMYNLESIGGQGGSWAESVDLTRFIAADNEFEEFSDEVFPDVDPRDAMDDDDAKGNQFGGLETLDLHGNLLKAVPPGLRRLELLTALNLSSNKLSNDCFEIISQIASLRDLKLAGNQLSGALHEGITQLQNLETLDIQRNALTSLPEGLANLVRLRVLNVAENQLASLPFGSLRKLPLVELVARKNKLSGTLVAPEVETLPHLQILDVTSNSLTSLAVSELELPALHQLSCAANRLKSLPNVTSWTSLLTIAAEDNSISCLPNGFVTLSKVKNVDFSGNDLKSLDDRIGGMKSLVIFRISGNPLREKKFSSMAIDDLKRALKARMELVEPEVQDETSVDGDFWTPPSTPSSSSAWEVKAGGILDRADTKSSSLNPVAAAQVASENAIKVLELHHNTFQEIPSSIAFFAETLTSLNLAHNELTSDTFLREELELPALKELNLSSNTLNSLQPLMQRLLAPRLERLDISFNRLTSLPVLRTYFPNLTTLLASNNTIRELSPEAVKGLHVLDCTSNDINSLNARIGLLGGPGGLQRLDVSGNRFRVPKYTVLEKGTEATLAWLRDRIPVGETSITDVD